MADSFIQVPPDSTGKLVDAEQLTVGSNTVQRERHEMCGSGATEIARVLNSQPAGTEYGLVVREAQKAQQTMANSQPVVIASDQTSFPVTVAGVSSATLSNVASSASNVTLLSSHSTRSMAAVFNDSTQILYLKFGATASTSSYTVQVQAAGYYEFPLPVYTGQVDGIWASANGNARVTEY